MDTVVTVAAVPGTPVIVPAIFDLSGWHMIVILIVALLLFGRRLPEIMRGLGSSVREFKSGMNESHPAPTSPPPTAPSGQIARDAAPPAGPSAPAAQPPAKN